MQNRKCEFLVGEGCCVSEACRVMWERNKLTGGVMRAAEGNKVRES